MNEAETRRLESIYQQKRPRKVVGTAAFNDAVEMATVAMCRSGPDFSLNANPSRDWKIL